MTLHYEEILDQISLESPYKMIFFFFTYVDFRRNYIALSFAWILFILGNMSI